ncbi:hypothetical protein chiPu_0001910 [Chiloscyllium punctatum]|uniref:Uncharacterized protein n=1 Tax=Chiloscyllium punctatum TaxID=137246 RepID=A0A401RZD0_CHIPU|nr:hypothetical protein [Chiloscyllium punctatum]
MRWGGCRRYTARARGVSESCQPIARTRSEGGAVTVKRSARLLNTTDRCFGEAVNHPVCPPSIGPPAAPSGWDSGGRDPEWADLPALSWRAGRQSRCYRADEWVLRLVGGAPRGYTSGSLLARRLSINAPARCRLATA